MRRILPVAIAGVIGVVALAGCASAGGPSESSAPPAPTVTETVTAEPSPEPTTEPTADPQPSEVADAPYALDDEQLSQYSLEDVGGDEPLVVWADAERTAVHVIGAGSSTAACIPVGEEAEIDDGVIEIDFSWDHAEGMVACTADLRPFGWAFPLLNADASITQAVISDWTEDADDITVEIMPVSEAH